MPEPVHWLERQWHRISPWHFLLWPLSLVFGAVVALRRLLYRAGLLPTFRAPVPVVVVGNVSVGGTGKTPLVRWLAQRLTELGWHPGIVSRGYRGATRGARLVTAESTAAEVGDEALLLGACSPVCVAANRPRAVRLLLAAHPECDVLLSDDGLQHYRLRRDFEIAVIDAERKFGNGFLLPAGPLREPSGRLASVDALVCHGAGEPLQPSPPASPPQFGMQLIGERFYNLLNPDLSVPPQYFKGQTVQAVAGIGNPKRFFRHLVSLGIGFSARAYPDHHAFRREDLEHEPCDALIMTEKDAVKCQPFATEKCWALVVEAQIEPDLALYVDSSLRKRHGPEAT